MKAIKPSPYFSFVVHLDGLRETHDIAVERKGGYDVAVRAIKEARAAGDRVWRTNALSRELFAMLNGLGGEGVGVWAGCQDKQVSSQSRFRPGARAHSSFRRIFEG